MFTSIDNDADFISFWRANTQFFAYYVILSRKYAEFKNNPELLLEYLQQRGLYICHDETLENLKYLMKRYYDEIRKRGTIQVINKRTRYDLDDNSDSNSSSDSYGNDSHEIDGELLRTICFDKCNEFIFNLRKSEKLGFNIGNSSPMYRGTSNMESTNKIWSRLLLSTDYVKYPLFGNVQSLSEGDESDSDSNSDAHINEGYALNVYNNSLGQQSGVGFLNIGSISLADRLLYGINVDNNIDYEISFRVKTTDYLNNFFDMGVNAFDCDGNTVNLYDIKNVAISTSFTESSVIPLIRNNKYFYFRAIIYSKNRFPLFDNTIPYKKKAFVSDGLGDFYVSLKEVPIGILIGNTTYWRILDTDEKNSIVLTSWNTGNNLQFTSDVKKIVPYIKVTNSAGGINNVYIDDMRIQPVATNYSGGFIQTNNWIDLWLKNNNQNYSYDQLKEIFKKYLLPYDTEFEFNKLEYESQLPRSYTFNINSIVQI